MRFRLVVSLLVFTIPVSNAGGLKPFSSDGCSAFPDGTPKEKQLWLACCTKHDLAYWQGGSYDERLRADKSLRQCVATVGKPHIAKLMLAGVRVGGTPYLPTSFRWGYGWPYPKLYGELIEEELAQVAQMKNQIKLGKSD